MKYVPNILTVARIILTFVFLSYIYKDGVDAKVLAASVFFVAGVTDFFDGYIARKYKITSDFGKIMDPISDKFLVLAGFFTFVQLHYIPMWMFIVIAVREIYLTYLRLAATQKGIILAAEGAGKYKTFLQMLTIGFILWVILAEERLGSPIMDADGYPHFFWYNGIDLLMWAVVILTVYSGLQFLWNNKNKFFFKSSENSGG